MQIDFGDIDFGDSSGGIDFGDDTGDIDWGSGDGIEIEVDSSSAAQVQ